MTHATTWINLTGRILSLKIKQKNTVCFYVCEVENSQLSGIEKGQNGGNIETRGWTTRETNI